MTYPEQPQSGQPFWPGRPMPPGSPIPPQSPHQQLNHTQQMHFEQSVGPQFHQQPVPVPPSNKAKPWIIGGIITVLVAAIAGVTFYFLNDDDKSGNNVKNVGTSATISNSATNSNGGGAPISDEQEIRNLQPAFMERAKGIKVVKESDKLKVVGLEEFGQLICSGDESIFFSSIGLSAALLDSVSAKDFPDDFLTILNKQLTDSTTDLLKGKVDFATGKITVRDSMARLDPEGSQDSASYFRKEESKWKYCPSVSYKLK